MGNIKDAEIEDDVTVIPSGNSVPPCYPLTLRL